MRTMIFSVLTYSLFTGAAYAAREPWHLMALRSSPRWGWEASGPWESRWSWSVGQALRPALAGIIGAAANVGFLMISTLGYIFPVSPDSWRWIMLAGASPAVLVFFIALFVPESERWKAAVRQRKAAPVREIFSGSLAYKTWIAIGLSAVALLGTWGSVQWVPYWVDKSLAPDDPSAKSLAQIWSSVGAIIGCLIAPLLGGHPVAGPSISACA